MRLRSGTVKPSTAVSSPRKARSPQGLGQLQRRSRGYAKRTGEPTIVDVAVETADLTTLVTALKRAKLVKTLHGEGNFTVFAPTNEAFANLPAGTVENLLAHPEQLKKVLLYHVAAHGGKSVV